MLNKYLALGILLLVACSEKESAKELQGPTLVENDSLVFSDSLPKPVPSKLVINELQVVNSSYLDGDGEDPGWVEIYNGNEEPVQLAGYGLSEKKDKEPWLFDSLVIEPGEYLVVFCSGKDRKQRVLPLDSLYLMSEETSAWADGAVKGGNSKVSPLEFAPKYTGTNETGVFQISGFLEPKDNAPDLNWSSSQVQMGFEELSEFAVVDLSEYDFLTFQGKVTRGVQLQLRFLEKGIDDWMGWTTSIVGTGEWKEYVLRIDGARGDRTAWYGVKFEAVPNTFLPIEFTIAGMTYRDWGSKLHTSFKLEKDGGEIFLVSPEKEILHRLKYPALNTDESFGLDQEKGAWVAVLETPTPGFKNSSVKTLPFGMKEPEVSGPPSSGFYQDSIIFSLDSVPGVSWKYTLGGSEILSKGTPYTGPFKIDSNTVVRVLGFYGKSGYKTKERTFTYLFDEEKTLPVISLVVEDSLFFDEETGMYMKGPNASREYPYFGANFWDGSLEPTGRAQWIEGGLVHWEEPLSVRIFGNYSRGNDKKSLSLHFREDLGTNALRYQVFEDYPDLNYFKSIVLRNNGNNTENGYFNDALMTGLVRGLDIDVRKYRPAVLYINGKYWGIHNIREKINGAYFKTNYNVEEADLDLIKPFGEVQVGASADWESFKEWVGSHGDDPAFVQVVDSILNVNNWLNYLVAEVFYANTDWPANNFKVWRDKANKTKWKYVMYDTDFGFGALEDVDKNMMEHITNDTGDDWPNGAKSTFLIRALLENEYFKNLFIHRNTLLLDTYFHPDRVDSLIHFYHSRIATEIPLDQKRWNLSATRMEVAQDQLEGFANLRQRYLLEDLEEYFNLQSPLSVEVDPKGGTLYLAGFPITEKRILRIYPGVPLEVSYVGEGFTSWFDGSTEPVRNLLVDESIKAITVN